MIEGLKPYPEMKVSGIPWAGRVPTHWGARRGKRLFAEAAQPVREGDEIVTCFRDGQVTLRRNRRASGYMIALQEVGYQGVRRGQLVIHAMDAFAGAVGVSDSDGKCTPEYIVCRPREPGLSPAYYAAALRIAAHTNFIQISCDAVRERAPRLRYPNFGEMVLPVPPPDEQALIVRFLDHADRRIRRLIAAKQRMIKLLEEQTRVEVLRLVTRGLSPVPRLRASGDRWLGDIPEGWTATTLGRLMAQFRTGPFGSSLHQEDYVSGGIPLINPTHMRGGQIVPEEGCTVTSATADRLEAYRLREGDIVFSRRGELGRCALVTANESGWLCGTGSVIARPRHDLVDARYLVQALQAPWVADFLSSLSVGATMQSLNTSILRNLPVLVPPTELQAPLLAALQVKNTVDSSVVSRVNAEITFLREYRTRLICDVVTGQLDVRAAAASLPADTEPAEPLDDAEPDDEEEGDEPADEVAE